MKNMDISNRQEAIAAGVKIFGSSEWQTICKASNQAEGWMKTTQAMHILGAGSLVKVTTQQLNPDSNSYSLAEALTFVPGVGVLGQCDHDGRVIDNSFVLDGGCHRLVESIGPDDPIPGFDLEGEIKRSAKEQLSDPGPETFVNDQTVGEPITTDEAAGHPDGDQNDTRPVQGPVDGGA